MSKKRKKIISVVGARPNFVKVAPIAREFVKNGDGFEHLIIHTGQHYDEKMSKVFFDEMEIPKPDINLGIGSGSHGEQTGKIMIEFEKVCFQEKPDMVLIYGDVNSTIAAALVAGKLNIRIGHVEAGLRSFDRTMPEEINRILSDAISDFLFIPSEDANINLMNEGIDKNKIYLVGNIMVDSLMFNKEKASKLNVLSSLNLTPNNYAVLTMHRPSNVDDEENIVKIFSALNVISEDIPVVFPTHPRTSKLMQEFNINVAPGIKTVVPLGYLEFLSLMMNSKFMLTDSGGIQEETTVLGIPCLTIRKSTERPVTVDQGTNILVGDNTDLIVSEVSNIIKGNPKKGSLPRFWDGRTAGRIMEILRKEM
jgi:UDP-N-acetylglucosamine 2-epimerase (non-hydrolysing)